MRKVLIVLAFGGFVGLVACSGGKKGDSCKDEGLPSNCDDKLLCTSAKSDGTGGLICLPTCVGQEDCAANEQCGGSSNQPSIGIPKVCRVP
jgi:hypothetical protein